MTSATGKLYALPDTPRPPRPLSNCCRAVLLGSAARWCGGCGGTVAAADIDHETHAPLRRAG